MPSVLDRRLVVITGKGGVGKTTLSAAIGLLAARRGRRTIVVELNGAGSDAGAAGRLAALLGHSEAPAHGEEVPLAENLWGLSIDRDRVVAEWLRALGGRVPARMLTSSSTFQYLVAAAPGTREMTSMVKLWELAQDRRPGERHQRASQERSLAQAQPAERESHGDYDLVVLDAPATGHALALLRSPQVYTAIARTGPIARQARQIRELFADPELSGYLGVAHATEMATSETIELQEGLRRELGRELDAVLVNGSLPRRFEQSELSRIAALAGEQDLSRTATGTPRRATSKPASSDLLVKGSAARAAIEIQARARAQQGQIARLRRRGVAVMTVPFAFQAELDLTAVQAIADRLERIL
jgi:anion-transporting  ArsA/GET3 family ATPase